MFCQLLSIGKIYEEIDIKMTTRRILRLFMMTADPVIIQHEYKIYSTPLQISILKRSSHQSHVSICKGSCKIYYNDRKNEQFLLYFLVLISLIMFDWHENYRLSKSYFIHIVLQWTSVRAV